MPNNISGKIIAKANKVLEENPLFSFRFRLLRLCCGFFFMIYVVLRGFQRIKSLYALALPYTAAPL
jgi:hypothetical protein